VVIYNVRDVKYIKYAKYAHCSASECNQLNLTISCFKKFYNDISNGSRVIMLTNKQTEKLTLLKTIPPRMLSLHGW